MTKFIESHMRSMSVLFQSHGLVVTCQRTPAGSTWRTSNVLEMIVIGCRQHAQYDSRRQSLPWKGGMFDTAMASLAQPM